MPNNKVNNINSNNNNKAWMVALTKNTMKYKIVWLQIKNLRENIQLYKKIIMQLLIMEIIIMLTLKTI